jgi:hypothetical protein
MNIEQIDRIEAEISTTFFSATKLSANSLLELCALARRGLIADTLSALVAPPSNAGEAERQAGAALTQQQAASTSEPYIALLDELTGYAYAIATADGNVLVHLDRGTMRNESEGGVEKLLALLNRTQEPVAARVTEAMVVTAVRAYEANSGELATLGDMRAALEAAARVGHDQKCEHCGGSGFVNVIDEDGEAFADVCDGPAHDHASHVGFDAGLEVGGTAHRKVKP